MTGINEEQMQPSLTLTPFSSVSETEVVSEQQTEKPIWDDSLLSEAEREQIQKFASEIDISNSTMVMQYGAGAQKKLADFSEKALENVRTQDLGEIGNMLSNVISELRNFDTGNDSGLFGFFRKGANKIAALKTRYEKVESSINTVCKQLEERQLELMKDAAMLDKMYELNKTYFKELSMYILAGKKRLDQIRNGTLAELVAQARQSGKPEDAQAAKDMESLCVRFEKKLYDLELSRTISLQTAPQLRLVQDNDTIMAEKIQSTLINTIPLWKNQMVIALGVEHANQAAEAQRSVTDMTNQLLRKNADALKTATINTARESERGIADIETLKATNESLIATFDEVVRIQDEGRQKRMEAEAEMLRIEQELKAKMIEISGRKSP